jgi:hypothetical protein
MGFVSLLGFGLWVGWFVPRLCVSKLCVYHDGYQKWGKGTMSRPTHICFFLELVGRLRPCVVTGVLGLFNRDFRSTMEKR